MARFAEVENGRVRNILEADVDYAALRAWVFAAEVSVGDLYDAEDASFRRPSPVPDAVPLSVSRRQFRQALLLAGRLSEVESAINGVQDPVQRELLRIEWDDSQVFERARTLLITLATALGLDDDGTDQLFIAASQL
ncbi:MAG: hypothetical protein ACO1PM_23530 [Acidovorax sp.]